MIDKIIHYIWSYIYKALEGIGAGISYVLYQWGVLVNLNVLDVSPVGLAILHGVISILVPVVSFFLIHVFKELLKDKESWCFKLSNRIIIIVSFKRKK